MYNKRQFTKANDKKVLHKVRKQWVTISLALFMMIGGGAVVTSVNASANSTNNQNKPKVVAQLKPKQSKLGSNQAITTQAKAMHQHLLSNATIKNHKHQNKNVNTNKRPVKRISNVNKLKPYKAGYYKGTIYNRINTPFNKIRITHHLLLHSTINSIGHDNHILGNLYPKNVVKISKAFKGYDIKGNSSLKYEIPLHNKRNAFITGNNHFVFYVAPTTNYRYYRNKINHILKHSNNKKFSRIRTSVNKLARRENRNYHAYMNLYVEAYNTQQALHHPVITNYSHKKSHKAIKYNYINRHIDNNTNNNVQSNLVNSLENNITTPASSAVNNSLASASANIPNIPVNPAPAIPNIPNIPNNIPSNNGDNGFIPNQPSNIPSDNNGGNVIPPASNSSNNSGNNTPASNNSSSSASSNNNQPNKPSNSSHNHPSSNNGKSGSSSASSNNVKPDKPSNSNHSNNSSNNYATNYIKDYIENYQSGLKPDSTLNKLTNYITNNNSFFNNDPISDNPNDIPSSYTAEELGVSDENKNVHKLKDSLLNNIIHYEQHLGMLTPQAHAIFQRSDSIGLNSKNDLTVRPNESPNADTIPEGTISDVYASCPAFNNINNHHISNSDWNNDVNISKVYLNPKL